MSGYEGLGADLTQLGFRIKEKAEQAETEALMDAEVEVATDCGCGCGRSKK